MGGGSTQKYAETLRLASLAAIPSDLFHWQKLGTLAPLAAIWVPTKKGSSPQPQDLLGGGWKLGKWWCGGLRGKKYFDDLLTRKNLSPPQLFISAHTGTVLGVSERIVRRGQSRCEPGSTRFISTNPSALTQSCHRRAVTAAYHHAATLLVGLVGRTNRYQPDCSTRGLLCAA